MEKKLDVFENELIGTTYNGEFKTRLTLMEFVANNRTLPKNK